MDSSVANRDFEKTQESFAKALRKRNLLAANNIAMAAVAKLFEYDAAMARTLAWEKFYSHLPGRGVPYQAYDFECVDYELYRIDGVKKLLRGPEPDLGAARGRYITFLGAAQLFGRHQRRPPHVTISEALGIPCVNLSASGAGPEYFCSERILKIANGGIAVVVQVMSGRSIGCEEYPGGDKTRRKGTNEKIKRLKLLTEIWEESKDEAIRLTKKWQSNYVRTMSRLLSLIEVPTVLAWVSARTPSEWSIGRIQEVPDFGKFPHLVDESMIRQISNNCTQMVSVRDEGLPHEFVSRFSGERCPVLKPDGSLSWENKYYCSSLAGQRLSMEIEAALRDIRVAF